MARPSAIVTATIEANMDQIARAEQSIRELQDFRQQAAALYHHAGILVQRNLETIAALRTTNAVLTGAQRRSRAAA